MTDRRPTDDTGDDRLAPDPADPLDHSADADARTDANPPTHAPAQSIVNQATDARELAAADRPDDTDGRTDAVGARPDSGHREAPSHAADVAVAPARDPDDAAMTEAARAPALTSAAPRTRRSATLAPPEPDADLRVAHSLLRSGNALPARVHLETLAGRRELDLRGLLDLGESRWRTGDVAGAGDAAAAYLEAGGTEPLGFLIAAEATALAGRPGEARKLARRALEDLDESVDALFAGQPRSGIWPHDPAAQAVPTGTLFAPPPNEASRGGRIGLTLDAPAPSTAAGTQPPRYGPTPMRRAEDGITADLPSAQRDPGQPVGAEAEIEPDRGLWDPVPEPPNPQSELDAARAALDAGDPRAAAVRSAVVLRMSPALAPVVLDLVGQLPGPDFDLLRGDALRLVGHEAAAERAFAAAADALRTQTPRSPE